MLPSSEPLVGVLAAVWLVFWHFIILALNENGPFSKQWASSKRTCFFTTNRRANPPPRPTTYFALEEHDAQHLISCSILQGKGAVFVLLVYRAFAVAYVAFTVYAIERWGEGVRGDFLKFFTHWNLVLVAAYGVLGVCACGVELQRRRRAENSSGRQADESLRSLEPLFHSSSDESAPAKRDSAAAATDYTLLDACLAGTLTTAATCSVLLTAVFWLYIYPAQDHDVNKVDLPNVLRHGVNVLVTLGDAALSRTPVCGYWYHAVLGYASTYALFFGVLFVLGIAPYTEVLDKGIFWISVALPFVLILAYAVTWSVAHVRETFLVAWPLEHSTQSLSLPFIASERGQLGSPLCTSPLADETFSGETNLTTTTAFMGAVGSLV